MMKTKPILPILLALCFAVSCKKEDPPIPPTEPVVKYLSKVWYVKNGAIHSEMYSCTWDSQYRLKTYQDEPFEYFTFNYDSLDRVSRIDFYGNPAFAYGYGYGFLLCHWKNEKELNYIDMYLSGYEPIADSLAYLNARDIYHYDSFHKCIRITRQYILGNIGDLNTEIEWDNSNITKCYSVYYDTDTIFHINAKYDAKYNAYSALPKIPLMTFSPGFVYNPSAIV